MRILVFQTAYLGDVVLTTALLATLRKQFPDAFIAIAVLPAWVPVLEHAGLVDSIIGYDKRGRDAGTMGTLRIASKIRKMKFDVVLCPHPSFRSGLILRLANIKRRVGFDTSSGSFFFTEKIVQEKSQHEVLRVLRLSKALGISKDRWIDKTQIKPDPAIDADAIIERLGFDKGQFGLVGVHPGSVWATKRWLPERFATTCKTASEQGLSVLVFGTEGERDLVERIVGEAGTDKVKPAIGLSLAELIAVFSRLMVYITNDSGPMHIASALQIPVVAIFGSTVPAQGYGPRSEIFAVVETDRLPCRPCGPHGHDECPLGHFLCMKKVEPISVLLALKVISGGFAGTGFQNALFQHGNGI